jgi:hypothetical protein
VRRRRSPRFAFARTLPPTNDGPAGDRVEPIVRLQPDAA